MNATDQRSQDLIRSVDRSLAQKGHALRSYLDVLLMVAIGIRMADPDREALLAALDYVVSLDDEGRQDLLGREIPLVRISDNLAVDIQDNFSGLETLETRLAQAGIPLEGALGDLIARMRNMAGDQVARANDLVCSHKAAPADEKPSVDVEAPAAVEKPATDHRAVETLAQIVGTLSAWRDLFDVEDPEMDAQLDSLYEKLNQMGAEAKALENSEASGGDKCLCPHCAEAEVDPHGAFLIRAQEALRGLQHVEVRRVFRSVVEDFAKGERAKAPAQAPKWEEAVSLVRCYVMDCSEEAFEVLQANMGVSLAVHDDLREILEETAARLTYSL